MATRSTAVAERPQSAVPALAGTPALDIDAGDIALPKLYKGEYQSDFVMDKLVPEGSLFVATGKDDPDPQVIWTPGDDEGVLFHVLNLRKGRSIEVDGELETFAFNDPNAPEDSWVTYQYAIALPEVEELEGMPVKLLLTRTSTPTAKRINLLLAKNAGRGPAHALAFRLTTAPRKRDSYRWFVFQARQVEADASNIEAAEAVAEMVSNVQVERTAPAGGSEPSI